MAKRRTGAGGYPVPLSGEDEEPQPQTKKTKLSYAPPRFSALGKPGASGFQLPKAKMPTPSARDAPQPTGHPRPRYLQLLRMVFLGGEIIEGVPRLGGPGCLAGGGGQEVDVEFGVT
ncbi:hypothetical protein BDV93DRAFT_504576 [Ceratobasidium sp. AG-I]|nr:hypothetical protein BDV93DRAFT_504576 [Ceratobasidium sp. AG-I]